MAQNEIHNRWAKAVEKTTEQDLERLHNERGYSPDFCKWLHVSGLIGVLDGTWAFPNCDSHNQIVSIHYRAGKSNWRYLPTGQATHPLVIRGSGPITSCHDFESQWDAFAIMDRLALYERPDFMAIITRGAANGALVGNVELAKDVEVFIWAQEDGELEEHRDKAPEDRPSERWIKAVKEGHNGACRLFLLRPPEGFKDWNELTRNGISAHQLSGIIAKARAEAEDGRRRYETNTREVQSDADDEQAERRSPFPAHCLSPLLSEMVEATAESIGVHINLPAIASIAVVSASLGKGVYAHSGPDQRMRGNLFVVGSANSGTGKSEGIKPITLPLKSFEDEKRSYFNEITYPELDSKERRDERRLRKIEQLLNGKNKIAIADEKALIEEHKSLIAGKAEIDEKLFPPTITAEDTTQEAAAVILSHNNEKLFMFSPDAAKAVSNLEGLYNKLSVPDDNFYVKGYSGDPFVVHRLSRPSIYLRSPCISLLWLLQPDLLERMLQHRRLRDGGFLARLLICDTQLVPTELRRDARPIPRAVREAYDNLIKDLLGSYWESRAEREILVEPQALEFVREFHDELVPRRKSDLADIGSFVARWHEQALRTAIVLHAGLHGERAVSEALTLETTVKAIEIVRWFGNEQLRLLSGARRASLQSQADDLRDLLLTRYHDGVSLRDLYVRHNRDANLVTKIVAEFPTMFQIEEHRNRNGGRPSTWLRLASPRR
jgi:hypothetical protein